MTTPPPLPTRSRFPWTVKLAIGVAALPVLALVLFYPVENWRGKRAWEKCKQELAAKGEALEWDAYIPPPVPDEQNVFKAPHMAEWFVGRGTNDLVCRLDPENLLKFSRRFHTNVVIDLSVVSYDAKTDHQDADLVLRYDPPILTRETGAASVTAASSKIPLVRFEDVPLRIALQNLARQAELNYMLDPKLDFDNPDKPEPIVTRQWQDVTAMQAMFALLNHYDLQWIEIPNTKVAVITRKQSGSLRLVYADDGLRQQLARLIENSILPAEDGQARKPGAKGVQGLELVLDSARSTKAARVILKAEKLPNLKEVVEFFPTNVVFSGGEKSGLRVEAGGDHFRILLAPPPFTTVEYLAWSDQFLADFAAMREALQRPHARIEGDYQQPFTVPIPNYLALRLVTQTLAQRAQCFLLLEQPDQALRELTLTYELNRSLANKPITLVAAMIETAITGMYVDVVAEGLRRQTWREPQLAVIQEQFRQINLLPSLAESLRSERAGMIRTLEIARTGARARRSGNLPDEMRGLLNHSSWLPRGWFEQNYAVMANVQRTLIESLDVTNRVVFPVKARLFGDELGKISKGFRPYTFAAAILIPDFSLAVQTLAFQQTRADEALVACALERYRLTIGAYPEALTALSPQFLETVPHDIMGGQPFKYRREGDARFVLYSVGWNEADDHGIARQYQNGSQQISHGDWVWQPSESSDNGLLTAK